MYYLQPGSANSESPAFQRLAGEAAIVFPEFHTAKWIYECGVPEQSLIEWVRDTYVRPDKVFVDIGAHIGTYSLACASRAAHTYAFECSPKTFCFLAANVALRGLWDKITPHRTALGNCAVALPYYVRSEDGGGNGCKPTETAASIETILVEQRTLDSFGLTNIGCIKIDVEGFEKEVLEGATHTLQASGYPPIVFESWGEWKQGIDAAALRKELFDYVGSLGYTVIPIRGYADMFVAVHRTQN
jgi:FkbM family methyltransferase